MIVTFSGPFPAEHREKPARRRLFRVKGGDEAESTSVRTLTDEELSEYDRAMALLQDFGRGDQLIIAAEANFDEFAESAVTAHNAAISDGKPRPDTFALALTMNRRLSNYLATRRLYLNFTGARLKRRYGRSSRELAAFEEITESLAATQFAYRFTEYLRDYSQHCGFPIGHFSSGEHATEPAKTVELAFDLRELVANGSRRQDAIRIEIGAMDPLQPIVPVLDAAQDHLRIIRDHVLEVERPRLETAVDWLSHALFDAGQPDTPLRVGRWLDQSGRLAIEYDDLPLWEIRQLAVKATDGLSG